VISLVDVFLSIGGKLLGHTRWINLAGLTFRHQLKDDYVSHSVRPGAPLTGLDVTDYPVQSCDHE